MKIDWSKVRGKAAAAARKVQPYTRAAERATGLLVHMKTVTPIGAVGLAASVVNSAHEWLNNPAPCAPSGQMPVWLDHASTIEALTRAGAEVVKREKVGEVDLVRMRLGILEFYAPDSGCLTDVPPDPEFRTWARQAFDRYLPPAIRVVKHNEHARAHPLDLPPYETEQATSILAEQLPMLADGPRCILLNGKPGVGKTTIAKEIGRRANLGRVAVLEPGVAFSAREEGGWVSSTSTSSDDEGGLRSLSPGVIVVDDVDKLHLNLGTLEVVRQAAKLTILTANNAESDEVVDGAVGRCGRIDEMYTIVGERKERDAPFDRLDEATWERVREWPIAYLNELSARIRNRGVSSDALRIDDLAQRIERRTRSGMHLG